MANGCIENQFLQLAMIFKMNKYVLQVFGWDELNSNIYPIKSGLINHTWKVNTLGGASYILQQINTAVFQQPEAIDRNIKKIASYLQKYSPDYLLPKPIESINNQTLECIDGKYFRAFHFIEKTSTVDAVKDAHQAYEAAFQFGNFSALLNQFPIDELEITIPHFHDLSFRVHQFENSLQNALPDRKTKARDEILFLQKNQFINQIFQNIQSKQLLKLRVMHHDTKISNVLFDEHFNGLCVIDLDTIMPGYFISDLGDMIRTYLTTTTEEEKDFNKILIREEIYDQVICGYYSAMKTVLTNTEKAHFYYAGLFMIYMQALRFLTDYFQQDVYYKVTYPDQNLNRAKTQIKLLVWLLQNAAQLRNIAAKIVGIHQENYGL